MNRPQPLPSLVDLALDAGADRAAVIPAGKVVVDGSLADRCRAPRCPNYGLSINCPPHVPGPLWFQKEIENYTQALFFTIAVPSDRLFSDHRGEAFARLQKTAVAIEQKAVQAGFARVRAYAGGSCRETFCHTHGDCPPLLQKGVCRYPQYARPSMSGFGIDVARLFETAGWTMRMVQSAPDAGESSTADICGLILIN